MSYSSQKGYSGEVEAYKFFQSIYKKDLWARFGGQEFSKKFNGGDIGIVPTLKKVGGMIFPDRQPHQSPIYQIFFEVKNQANPNVWGAMKKAEDDMQMFNKSDAVLYVIKHKKNERGERLVVLRPETLKMLLERGI